MVKEDSRIQIKYMVYACLLGVAIIVDIFWFVWYTKPLWGEYIDSDSLWVLRRLVVVVSFMVVAAEVRVVHLQLVAFFLALSLGFTEPFFKRTW
jgi:hypothetical protein